MPDDTGQPSAFKRFAPWLLAIAIGVGIGWLVGGLIAPERPEVAAADSRPAPPPVPATEKAPPRPQNRELGPSIALGISNRDCNWGADYAGYYRQAQTILLHTGQQSGRTAETVRVRVPDRPWSGLTVTAIEAVHEGSGIIFAEPLTEVRAALTLAGIQVAADGRMPLEGDAAAVQAIRPTDGNAARYGATVLTCGA